MYFLPKHKTSLRNFKSSSSRPSDKTQVLKKDVHALIKEHHQKIFNNFISPAVQLFKGTHAKGLFSRKVAMQRRLINKLASLPSSLSSLENGATIIESSHVYSKRGNSINNCSPRPPNGMKEHIHCKHKIATTLLRVYHKGNPIQSQ